MNGANRVIIQRILERLVLAVDITVKHNKIIMLLNGRSWSTNCRHRAPNLIIPAELVVVLAVRAFVQFKFLQIIFVFFPIAPRRAEELWNWLSPTVWWWNFFCVRNCVGLRTANALELNGFAFHFSTRRSRENLSLKTSTSMKEANCHHESFPYISIAEFNRPNSNTMAWPGCNWTLCIDWAASER